MSLVSEILFLGFLFSHFFPEGFWNRFSASQKFCFKILGLGCEIFAARGLR